MKHVTRPGQYRSQLAPRAGLPASAHRSVNGVLAGSAVRASQAGKSVHTAPAASQPLLRSELGDVLRSLRSAEGRTLREVSSDAQVSLGYLSEVERGQKEASSELLESICTALGVPLWYVLREVSERMRLLSGAVVPDTVPDELMDSCSASTL